MNPTTPRLDISILNTYNSNVLSVADVSFYPLNYQVNNPYIEITPPGFPKATVIFNPKALNVFNSLTLGTSEGCIVPLPDGIYQIRYSIQPNYQIFVEKSYLRIDQLMEKYDSAFLKLDINECDTKIKNMLRIRLEEIEWYIQSAMAAANKCNDKLAFELFTKANKFLDKLDCYVGDLHIM